MKAFRAAGLSRAGVVRRLSKSDQSQSFVAPERAARRALLRSTCLSGAAAALLVFSPHHAHAADECGAPVEGVVTCPAGTEFPNGIQYTVDAPAPAQDLTIRLGDGLNVASTADSVAGVGGFNGTGGDVTISGTGGAISTSGSQAAGVSGIATSGAVTIDVGDVSTSGYRSDGIFASTNYSAAGGDVDIKAGAVSTSGEASVGVRASTYHGDIRMDLGSVVTTGYGSDGIFAEANYGNASVHVGYVSTSGDVGRGITVYSAGETTITADEVHTYGEGFGPDSDAGAIKAVGTKVTVDIAGAVTTSGDNAVGIYANTNHIVTDPTVANPDIDVSAGSVTTRGDNSDGVVAMNYSAGGVVHVNVGSISTSGANAFGVYAAGLGDITVDTGSVTTAGLGSKAIAAVSVYGDINVTAGTVQTSGVGGTGISTVNYSDAGETVISVGSLQTSRDYAAGIVAQGGGDIAISVGDLSTNGYGSLGVSALSIHGAIDVNAGAVLTHGDRANGIDTLAYEGLTTITAGSVTTTGANSLGVYAAGAGGMDIHLGDVTTSGKNALGVVALNFSADDVAVTAHSITTSGAGAGGLVVVGYGGVVNVDVGSITTTGETAGPRTGTAATLVAHANDLNAHFVEISTAGAHAIGVHSTAQIGDQHVVVDKSITTTGYSSPGVLLGEEFGNAVLEVGAVTTSGTRSAGIRGYVTGGDLTVNVGAVTTSGDKAVGIVAQATSFGRGPETYYGETQPYIYDGTIHVAVNSVTTSGADASGIVAVGKHQLDYGDSPLITNGIDIQTGTVTVTGARSQGISATSLGRISVDAGNTSSAQAEAISISAGKDAALNIRGATVSKAADAVVMSGRDLDVTVAAGGGVSGATNGLVLTATGQISVANAGVLTSGTGYAILAQQGVADLTNSGRIDGAIKLADGGDKLTNSGAFNASRDSDFGGGDDLFVNTGTLRVAPDAAAAQAVSFLGLERFENTGGLVDLRNGHAGDVFTLAGDYVASGQARLGLDVEPGKADKLVVAGSATGATTIVLGGVTPATASLRSGPLTLVQAGAGSTGSFEIGNADVGLIHYDLKADTGAGGAGISAAAAGPVSYSLTASVGAPVYATLKLEESAQTAWRQSADAWSSHLAAMRGDAWAGGSSKGRFWAQAYGSTDDRKDSVGGFSTDYEQQDIGVQAGGDLLRKTTRLGDVVWGVTAGYATADIKSKDGLHKSDFETFNVGGYAALTHGAMFANALVKFDRHQIKTSDTTAGYSASLNGDSWGGLVEFGRRFGSDRFAVEPVASLAYVKSSLDGVTIYNQTLAFDDADGLTGKIGARVSGKRQLGNGTGLVFYGGAAAVWNGSGDQGLTFTSGGVSQAISAKGDGSYGQATLGVSARTSKGLTVYAEGDGDFGSGRDGAGLRLGARFNF